MIKKYAVIVAGGSGTRLGGDLPKQFQSLNGRPVLWWSMKAFHDEDADTQIILVLNRDFVDTWKSLYDGLPEEDKILHRIASGGDSRTQSVKNGIATVPFSEDVLIAVHDAARPLVTVKMIASGWEAAKESGAAIPAVAVTDSLRRLSEEGSVAVDRKDFVAVQTPQVFKATVLKGAYETNPSAVFTDDASAVEAAGFKPVLFEGSYHNMKVTNPGDMEIANTLLNA
ncbi:MAG: 2-C-methyl-D-erythritol 4-phosphate cytidylyltransferase [Bacteroides sp.]|nr:2-C-methyl-D-erythritol 4-phosphate cytidylyltransferase [Bacteroides sp.]